MSTNYIVPVKIASNNGIYLFEKQICVTSDKKVTVHIFASARYILYINGEYVCEGPCRGHVGINYYDTAEALLRRGVNNICIKVLHIGDIGVFTTVYKTPIPLAVFEAVSDDETYITDESWTCKYLEGHEIIRQGQCSLAPFEAVTCGKTPVDVGVKKLYDPFNFTKDGHYYYFVGAAIPFLVKERPIPMIPLGEDILIREIKRGDGYIDYAAEKYSTAKLKFRIKKNSKVKITYSECYTFEDGKHLRDDTRGTLNGFSDTVVTADEDYLFEPFWFRTFRFIRIEGDFDAITEIEAKSCHYPFDIEASFECSNEVYNKIFDVSQHTLLCCSHEIIVDCPYYEQQQYEMDATIELAVISRMTEDRRLHKKCLMEFAMSQLPSGLLAANYPSEYIQIIPGYSLFWIMMLRDYLDDTKDTAFVSGLIGCVDRILSFFGDMVAKHGYIVRSKHWDFIDWVPEWDGGVPRIRYDEAFTVHNLYYAAALKDAAYICERMGRYGLASEYRERYRNISDTINALCFNSKTGTYKDGSVTEKYSAHNIVWAILSGVACDDKIDGLISHLFDKDISRCTFAMNYYLFRALEKCGRYDLAFPFFDQWKKMLDDHCTTWCENPDSPRSECHAWSCAPYYEFLTNILGVKIGFENEIIICPQIADLSFARGTVATRFGVVSVDWSIENEVFRVTVCGAQGVNKKIILPNGKTHEHKDEKITLESIIK